MNTRATLFKSVSKVRRRRSTAECVFQFWRTLVQKSSRHTPPASQRGAGGAATYLKAAARLFRSPPKAYPPTFLLFVYIFGSNLAIIPSLFVSRSLHDDEYFAHEEVRRLHVNFEIKKMIRHFAEPGEGGRARRGFGWPTCQSRRSRPSRMIKYAPLDNKTVQKANFTVQQYGSCTPRTHAERPANNTPFMRWGFAAGGCGMSCAHTHPSVRLLDSALRELHATHACRAAGQQHPIDDNGEGGFSGRRRRDIPADDRVLGDQRDIHHRRLAGRWFSYF